MTSKRFIALVSEGAGSTAATTATIGSRVGSGFVTGPASDVKDVKTRSKPPEAVSNRSCDGSTSHTVKRVTLLPNSSTSESSARSIPRAGSTKVPELCSQSASGISITHTPGWGE